MAESKTAALSGIGRGPATQATGKVRAMFEIAIDAEIGQCATANLANSWRCSSWDWARPCFWERLHLFMFFIVVPRVVPEGIGSEVIKHSPDTFRAALRM
jgi:hypothetical protein